MSTNKEEFIQSLVEDVRKNVPDADIEAAEKLAEQIWTGRAIMRAVVLDDDFKTSAHRYYHGVGHARANLLSILPLGSSLLGVLAEHMFALGFMCGVADERGWDVDTVSPREEAAACLDKQENFLPALQTCEELDQADALPSLFDMDEDALAEGFGGTPPPDTPPELDEGGAYYPQ